MADDDSDMLDFLADPAQTIAQVLLPRDIVLEYPHSLRGAIRAAMQRWEAERSPESRT